MLPAVLLCVLAQKDRILKGFWHATQEKKIQTKQKTRGRKGWMPFLSGLLLSSCTHFPKGLTLLYSSGNVVYNHFLSFILPTFLKIYFSLKSLECDSVAFLFNISCEIFFPVKYFFTKKSHLDLDASVSSQPCPENSFSFLAVLWTPSLKGAGPAVHLGTCCMVL